ncbi:MAG: hypothetical protein WAL52_00240 [Candidatus Sulfotelmatobacter sp.]
MTTARKPIPSLRWSMGISIVTPIPPKTISAFAAQRAGHGWGLVRRNLMLEYTLRSYGI